MRTIPGARCLQKKAPFLFAPLFVGVGFIISATFAMTLLPAGNLLKNPGFESWNNGLPTGWSTYGTGAVLNKTTTKHSGSYALRLTSANKSAAAAGITDGKTPTVSSTITGVTYTGSCWAKASKSVTVKLQFHEVTKTGASVKPAVIVSHSVSTTWYHLPAVTFTAVQNGDWLPFAVYDPSIVSGGATVYIDDCALTAADTTPPSAPTGFTATVTAPDQVQLNWVAATDNIGVASYAVYRNGVSVATLAGSAVAYTDTTGITDGTAYTYTIAASDAAGNTSQAATAIVTTPPAAPTGLSIASPAQVPSLSWSASLGATSYNIYRDGIKAATTTAVAYQDITAPTGRHTYYVTAVDSGGESTAGPSVTAVVIPRITYSLSPAPPASGWYTTVPVTITFTCADNTGGSGVSSCSAPVTETADGIYKVSGTAMDTSGDTATTSVTVKLDATAPSIVASLSPQPDIRGWNNAAVTVSYTCHDNLSGIVNCPNPNTVSTEGGAQQVSAAVTDVAGNSSSITTMVNLDETPPTIGSPSWSTSSIVVRNSAALTVPAADNLSGVIGGEYYIGSNDPGQGHGTAMTYATGTITAAIGANLVPGSYTVNVRSEDAAGNWSPVVTTQLTVTDQAPAAPTALTATATSPTQINLSWTAAIPGSVPVASYLVTRNDGVSFSTTSIRYSDTSVHAGTAYSYSVVAIDPYGVTSTASVSAGDTPPANGAPYSLTEWDTALSSVIHADVTRSVTLPNGNILWVFGDTTQVNGNSTVGGLGYPHDAFVTQAPGTLNFTAVPGSYGGGWQQVPNWPDGTYFWMSMPVVDNGMLYVLGERVQNQGSSFSIIGQYIASFDANTLTYEGIEPVQVTLPGGDTNQTNWDQVAPGVNGSTSGWWVTGTHHITCSYVTDCFVDDAAFIPLGQFANTSAWQIYPNIIPASFDTGNDLSLIMMSPSNWVAFSKVGGAYGGTQIEELTASSITGPWTLAGKWAAPSPAGTITYGTSVHVEQNSPPGQVLVSYNVNGGSADYADYHALFEYLPD